jgi:hypothetical protein
MSRLEPVRVLKHSVAVFALALAVDAGAARAESVTIPDRPEIVARKVVGLSARAVARSEPITLDVFGQEIVAEPTSTELTPEGRTVWLGRVREHGDSLVVLVASDDRLTGHISLDGESFAIRPLADGTQVLDRVDLTQLPDELPPIEPTRKAPTGQVVAGKSSSLPLLTASDGIDEIRLLVLYTPAAGDALVDPGSAIQLAVTLTNLALANSLVSTPIVLAGMAEIDFGTTDIWMGSELIQLTKPDDGIADEAHVLRDELEADVVMLVSDSRGACGISNLLLDLSIDSAENAFSITHHSCMGSAYTFTHELGHTLGAGHDRQAGCVGLFPFSCGYKHEGFLDLWRTVMAYPCNGVTCPRILNFSNPDVTYLRDPTGVSGDSSVATDNAKTIAIAVPTVASFRGPSIVPLDVTATENLFDGVRVDWTPPEIPAAAYRVQRFDRWTDKAPSKIWSVGGPPFFDESIESNGERFYRVSAFTLGLVQGPASSLVRGFRPSDTCGNGEIDDGTVEQCDGGSCCNDQCLIEPAAVCGRPVTGMSDSTCSIDVPSSADCLFIFKVAAALDRCEPACLCDVNAATSPGITPTDALLCLSAAVGDPAPLHCACPASE